MTLHIRRHANSLTLFTALLAFAVAGAGCYPRAGPAPGALSASSVTWASARWPGVTVSSLAGGRELFLAKCNGCHEYPDLSVIGDQRWPGILERMARKSHIDADGRDAILHYVLAVRSQGGA